MVVNMYTLEFMYNENKKFMIVNENRLQDLIKILSLDKTSIKIRAADEER